MAHTRQHLDQPEATGQGLAPTMEAHAGMPKLPFCCERCNDASLKGSQSALATYPADPQDTQPNNPLVAILKKLNP